MTTTTLRPVFVGLRAGLVVLVVALITVVVARTLLDRDPLTAPILALTALVALAIGVTAPRGGPAGPGDLRRGRIGLAFLTVVLVCLVWLRPEAAYLVFPTSFLYVHLLPGHRGTLAVLAATGAAVLALGAHEGWRVAGVVGPVIGAGVVVLLGRAYQALAREVEEREALVVRLLATQERLAATERAAGALSERAALARELHDTVAQGLASIQLLLHAAERADPAGPGVQHVQLARRTAAANLDETRRFIRERTPTLVGEDGLGPALRRLADTQWKHEGLTVRVRVADALRLPMPVGTAILRIAQGAMSNTIQHAEASNVTLSVVHGDGTVRLTVSDDGRGFDVEATEARPSSQDSFGLRSTRERVDALGGALEVVSAPGEGTTLVVDLPIALDLSVETPAVVGR
ncbi:sensor histidine kinase [Actinotalea sp.]|uniref:sensor histidine kinase n=1 Tax=Actinotalea sp. TaxID=1872145 RepID=UPI00356427A5